MDWIILLYILFVLFSGILSGIKEAQKKANIPKKLEPILIEKELEKEKVEEKRPKEEYKVPIVKEKPKLEKKETMAPYKVSGKKIPTFIERDLKEKLPEIIILTEILGPPRAFRSFGPPYRQRLP